MVLIRSGLLASNASKEIAALVRSGLEHEQQHQELQLADVKHLLFCNGLRPGCRKAWPLATLAPVPNDRHTPITHISYFEADAFARWKSATQAHCKGARLPTEFELESAVAPQQAALRSSGNFSESNALHPMPVARASAGLMQALGDVWEWTSSSYQPYPGYQPWAGAVGEYNGKFMVNQQVLRGGSCATPAAQARAQYRNFFPTDARWQFTGLRLARDGTLG